MSTVVLIGEANNVHVQRWSTAMSLEGFDLRVITQTVLNESSKTLYNQSHVPVQIVQDPPFTIRKITPLIKVLRLNKSLHLFNPKLVHIHYLTRFSLGATFNRSWKLLVSPWGKDLIQNDGSIYDGCRNYWRRYILNNADAISALSNFLASKISECQRSNRVETIVIPFGVDFDRFQPRERHNSHGDSLVLGFVKHLEPKYGILELIKSFALLHEEFPSLSLRIVGKGSLEMEVKHLIAMLGLEQKIKLLGALPHDEVPAFLSQLDIFVMPSIYESETLGVAAIEASAMKIPVVATEVGGVPEVVLPNRTGLLVPAGDVHMLAQAIKILALSKERRLAMGQEGRNYVLQKYHWKNSVCQMRDLYQRMLA